MSHGRIQIKIDWIMPSGKLVYTAQMVLKRRWTILLSRSFMHLINIVFFFFIYVYVYLFFFFFFFLLQVRYSNIPGGILLFYYSWEFQQKRFRRAHNTHLKSATVCVRTYFVYTFVSFTFFFFSFAFDDQKIRFWGQRRIKRVRKQSIRYCNGIKDDRLTPVIDKTRTRLDVLVKLKSERLPRANRIWHFYGNVFASTRTLWCFTVITTVTVKRFF